MSYRLLALDLDGTLLDSRLAIRPEVQEAIAAVRRRGLGVLLVTGRHHIATAPYHAQLNLDLPAICCNGTYLYDFRTGRAEMANPLTRTQALLLLRKIRQSGVHALMNVDDEIAYERSEAHLARLLAWAESLPPALRPNFEWVASFENTAIQASTIWKFVLSAEDREVLRRIVEEIDREIGLSCAWSGENRVDVAQSGNSKGALLERWLAQRGIAPSEVIAFGDNENDIGMLRLAGMGVAMGNATPGVVSVADRVTGTHDSSAIADVLEALVLAN